MLTRSDRNRLVNAIIQAFSKDEFEQLIRFNLDKRLDRIVDSRESFALTVISVLATAEREEWLIALLDAARAVRPHNPVFQALISELKARAVEPSLTTAHASPKQLRRQLRIFLCHSLGDKPAVRRLYRRLVIDGFEPWLDEEDLVPGQLWEEEIPRAVRASDVILVCLSRTSINKAGYVQKEIRYALDVADEQPEGRIFLIPVRLEACDVPHGLQRWQWVDLFDPGGYQRLKRALTTRENQLRSAE